MSAHNQLHDLYKAPYLMTDPGAAGTITVDRQLAIAPIDTTTGSGARTLAAPTKAGLICTVVLDVKTSTLTLTVTGGFDQGGSTSMSFDTAGDWATFMSVRVGASYYWRVLNNEGTNYSQDAGTFGEISATNVNATNVTATSTVQAATVNATNINATNHTASSTVQAATVNATNVNATNHTASSTVQAATVNATNINATNFTASSTVQAATVNATTVNGVNSTLTGNAVAMSGNALVITLGGTASQIVAINTMIGNNNANLLGFYGTTPVNQPAGVANTNNNVDTLATTVNSIIAALEELGLLATV